MIPDTARRIGTSLVRWATQWFWPRIYETWRQWNEDKGFRLAAATAYYAALAFFPLLIVLIAALGYAMRVWPQAAEAEQQLLDVISQQVALSVANQVRTILDEVETKAGVGGPLGLAGLLLSAVALFYQVESAFEDIWGIESQPKSILAAVKDLVFSRLYAFLMLVVLGLFILVVFIAGLVLSVAERMVSQLPGAAVGSTLLTIGSGVLLNTLILAVIYKVQPKVSVQWRDVGMGALLAAVLWEVGRQVLRLLVIRDTYSAYGVVGSFIAVLIWVYYAAAVLYLGAEFSQVTCRARTEPSGGDSPPADC